VPTLTIDGTAVPFEPGETILQAAARIGIAIPSLCGFPGIDPPTSCFVCVVSIRGRSALAPSCATLAEEGMVVESGTEEVRRYRRRALELLLSEHAGDCEAPCTRVCPAGLDVPAMARHIYDGDAAAAARAVRERLALPGVLGYVCPAPCEKGCYRARFDGAVSIRELHRRVAECVSGETAERPAVPRSGKAVAVVGAGPAGLSCAYYLALQGHACTVIDEREEPGGMLRYGTDRATLPPEVLGRDVAAICSLGVTVQMRRAIGDQRALDELAGRFDAVVLATGALAPGCEWPFDIKATAKGVSVDDRTFATSRANVFACGGAVAACRMAARAAGQGRQTAEAIDRFLARREPGAAWSPRCDAHLGKPEENELRALAATDLASRGGRGTGPRGPFEAALIEAAGRCMQCDCGKKADCLLRAYAQEYGANRDQYRTGARKRVTRARYSGGLVHEPGKCIDCGRCVGITAAEHIRPGLTFGNRGFEVEIKTPFGADLEQAMGPCVDRCVAACPVGALWQERRASGERATRCDS